MTILPLARTEANLHILKQSQRTIYVALTVIALIGGVIIAGTAAWGACSSQTLTQILQLHSITIIAVGSGLCAVAISIVSVALCNCRWEKKSSPESNPVAHETTPSIASSISLQTIPVPLPSKDEIEEIRHVVMREAMRGAEMDLSLREFAIGEGYRDGKPVERIYWVEPTDQGGGAFCFMDGNDREPQAIEQLKKTLTQGKYTERTDLELKFKGQSEGF